jgi:signal transduction histidine kinase
VNVMTASAEQANKTARESQVPDWCLANPCGSTFFSLKLLVLAVLLSSSSPAECSSRFVSAAHQMNIFSTVLAFAGAAALCSGVRWYLSRYATTMRIRLDERMQERNRIARDLHDTLLQTIQFSKMVADDAQEQPWNLERMQIALQKLSEWLERASKEGRTVLDSLRITPVHADDLMAALERALVECRLKAEIRTTVSLKGSAVDLHPMIHDELFRIGYEAIHNACTHAMAKSIDVELDYRRSLILRVIDDGIGIDPFVLAEGKKGHYGIVGMQERAARIGGRLSITSDAKGTRVVLSVPHSGSLEPR